MEKEILNVILEIVKQGGKFSLLGIFIYWFMVILTVAVKGGLVCLGMNIIINFTKHWVNKHYDKQATAYPVISSQASSQVLDTFNKLMTLIESKLSKLEPASKDSGKKTS